MDNNQAIAKIFYEIAQYLEMSDEPFKPQAYQKAALNLESLSEDTKTIFQKQGIEGLKEIPGIGQNLAEKIVEYLKTGKIKEYQELKKKIPVKINELTAVEGLGPKMVRDLYKKLKIKNLQELEKAAQAGKIRNLPRFGEKTERNILQSITFLKKTQNRFLLGEILPEVDKIIALLKEIKELKQISPAGSIRRQKETLGDVDILVSATDAEKVISRFVSLPNVVKIWGQGSTKASIRLRQGFDVDLRVVPENQFGSALLYFTGSKEHNIALRKIAAGKGLKLNEYGVFRSKKILASETEKKVYEILGCSYIEPELRENTGELEAAAKNALPRLITQQDIKGDLHIHSHWDGGADSIEELAAAGRQMGYEYIGIADHTKFLRIEHGLDEKQLMQQRKEIDALNCKWQIANGKGQNGKNGFKILQGCEANIMSDGSIDIKDEVLAKLDFVIAGVHSQFKMSKEKMTARIVKAMKNPNVDVISHPTGRIIQRRDEYEIDFDEILKTAKKTGTILEINANPYRLDLKDIYIKKVAAFKVKMIIGSDAHHWEQMRFIKFGISQARRGWAEKKDIINTQPAEKLLEFFS